MLLLTFFTFLFTLCTPGTVAELDEENSATIVSKETSSFPSEGSIVVSGDILQVFTPPGIFPVKTILTSTQDEYVFTSIIYDTGAGAYVYYLDEYEVSSGTYDVLAELSNSSVLEERITY